MLKKNKMTTILFKEFVDNLPAILREKYIEDLIAYYKEIDIYKEVDIYKIYHNANNSIDSHINKINWNSSIYGSKLWHEIAINNLNLEISIDFLTKKQIFCINLHSYILKDVVYANLIQRIRDLGISNFNTDEFPQRLTTSSCVVLLDWNKN
jgi:tellurite resistance-related uncharacterized protein